MTAPAVVLAARARAERMFDRQSIVRAIDQLAVQLTVVLAEQNPLLVCVMNGGLPFTAALMQRLQFPLEVTYVHVSRYGNATAGGELKWHARPDVALSGRHVVLVDDVLDKGVTLEHLQQWAGEAGAAAVTTVVLLDKAIAGGRSAKADYVALNCPDRYVFGWGMDYQGFWRNLPDIYALPEES